MFRSCYQATWFRAGRSQTPGFAFSGPLGFSIDFVPNPPELSSCATDWWPRGQSVGSRVRPLVGRLGVIGRRVVYWVGLCLAVSGCVNPPKARYVYQDGDYGVIGIPSNTFLGKTDYQAQAELLMSRHFPEGHEIVRAEEVIEGQKILDLAKKTEIGADPNLLAANNWIKLGKLGHSTSFEEKDQLVLRECRIIYKRKTAGTPSGSGPFASVASLTPRLYLDPNESLRHRSGTPTLANSGPVSPGASDSGPLKVSCPLLK
jgi:hypothetical protein